MKSIIAANSEAKQNIVKAAMYSYTGFMVYRKWSKSQHKFVRNRYEVVPLDCGYSNRRNQVLFAQDTRDHNMTKMFILSQIERFEISKKKIKTHFPIQLNNLKRMLGDIKNDEQQLDDENSL